MYRERDRRLKCLIVAFRLVAALGRKQTLRRNYRLRILVDTRPPISLLISQRPRTCVLGDREGTVEFK